MTVKIALSGATGRMGRAIARICSETEGIAIVGACAHPEDVNLGRDLGELAGVGNLGVAVGPEPQGALTGADVAIDFSLPAAIRPFINAAVTAKVPFVMGTTGLEQEHKQALEQAAKSVGVLWARNMSLGIQVLAELVEQAVAKLGAGYDVEIVDIHHRRKVDCPSGTAKRLADAAIAARPELSTRFAREGQVGPRLEPELGVFGLRGGDVPGDHTVYLLGDGERLELTHRATSRDVFARGAVRAACWLAGRGPGSYTIADVLSA